MKTKLISILLIALLFGTAVYSYSQEDEEMKLLFKPKHEKSSNGGYGAFQFGWTQVDGQSAITVGGRGAWIANHYFALGLAGNGFYSNTNDFPNNTNHTYALYGGYGGILIEPIVASMSTVHVSFPMVFGGGGVVASSYNMYDMTAAHRTLPFGTYVRVTNLENHRSVVVRINDRGPFAKDRIIDLSYAAARRLGMIHKGVAKVRIDVLRRPE